MQHAMKDTDIQEMETNMIAARLNNKNLLREAAYINGQWVESGGRIEITNPSDGSYLGTVPDLGKKKRSRPLMRRKKLIRLGRPCWPRTVPVFCAAGPI